MNTTTMQARQAARSAPVPATYDLRLSYEEWAILTDGGQYDLTGKHSKHDRTDRHGLPKLKFEPETYFDSELPF